MQENSNNTTGYSPQRAIEILKFIDVSTKSIFAVIPFLKASNVGVYVWLDAWAMTSNDKKESRMARWEKTDPNNDTNVIITLINACGRIEAYHKFMESTEAKIVEKYNLENKQLQPTVSDSPSSSSFHLVTQDPQQSSSKGKTKVTRSDMTTNISHSVVGTTRYVPKFRLDQPPITLANSNLGPDHIEKVVEGRKHYSIYESDSVKEVSLDYNTEVFWSKMDTKKTYSLIQFIKGNTIGFVIFITCREKMADSAHALFYRESINVIHYKNLLPSTDFRNYRGVLVVQLESLHLIGRRAKVLIPELLVLDESTSIMKQLSSSTMANRFHKNVKMLETITLESTRVICMDADIDDRTFVFLEANRRGNISVQWNTMTRKGVKAYKYFNRGQTIRQLLEDLDLGLKLFIACSYKSNVNGLEAIIKAHFPHKNVLTYTADNTLEELQKTSIQDVNLHWTQCDVVIISPTITNGIDFHEVHFDRVYSFVDPRGPSHRDLKQMIGRVRRIKTGEIHYTIKSQMGTLPTNLTTISMFMNLKYNFGLGLLEKSISESERECGIKSSDHISDYIHSKFEWVISEEDGDKIMTKSKLTQHWLQAVAAMNIQESNMSNNNIGKCFEDTLHDQNIPIEPVDLPIDDAECIELEQYFDRLKKEIKLIKFKHHSDIPIIDENENTRLKRAADSGKGTTQQREMVQRFEVEKYFKVPIDDGKEFDYVSRNLKSFKNRTVEEFLSVIQCIKYESIKDKYPFGGSYAAELRAINIYKEFDDPDNNTPNLINYKNVSNLPFRLNQVEGIEVLTFLNIAFNAGASMPLTDFRKFGMIMSKVFSSWLGAHISDGIKRTHYMPVTKKQVSYMFHYITHNDTFIKWYSEFNCEEQINYIKGIKSPLTEEDIIAEEEAYLRSVIEQCPTRE